MKKLLYIGGTVIIALLTVFLVRMESPLWWIAPVGYFALLVGRGLYWIAARANKVRDIAEANIPQPPPNHEAASIKLGTDNPDKVQIGVSFGDTEDSFKKEWSLFEALTAREWGDFVKGLAGILQDLGPQATVDDKLEVVRNVQQMVAIRSAGNGASVEGDANIVDIDDVDPDNPYGAQKKPKGWGGRR